MNKTERLQVLKDIIAIPTINDNEKDVADYLDKLFQTHHIDSHQVLYEGNRASEVAEIKGQHAGKTLAISGHLDVVDPGDLSAWHTQPFAPTELDGNLYGRGTTDMKSGTAAMVIALIELAEEKHDFNGTVRFLGTLGEEIGMPGSEQLTKEGYVDDIDALVIGEPSIRHIGYAHKGEVNYSIESIGKSVHSSMPEYGINAINYLLDCALACNAYFNAHPEKNDVLGPMTHNITVIKGGYQPNIIPDKASYVGNIRTIPEWSNVQIIKDLTAIVAKLNKEENCQLKLTFTMDLAPVYTSKDSQLIKCAQKAAKTIMGEDFPLAGGAGCTDASKFVESKNKFDIALIGPGNMTAHQVNENVNIEEFLKMVDVYKLLILDYLNA